MNITFDVEKLREMLENFYTLTKIRIVIFDDAFDQVISVPDDDCGFCGEVRKNPLLDERCVQCDRNARSICRSTDNIYIYTCHAGLYEAIAPIKMNGIILGYMMLGQIINKSEKKQKREAILQYAGEYIDCDLSEEYEKLTTKSQKQIEAAAKIMEACACYLWTNRLVSVNENCLAALISGYIQNNLTADLSVDALCLHFRISRNRLYKIARERYGMGIAEYIRKQRVQNAAALLRAGSTVTNAAISSGFEDYNYFSEIFKREMGILPSKYASRAGEDFRQPGSTAKSAPRNKNQKQHTI